MSILRKIFGFRGTKILRIHEPSYQVVALWHDIEVERAKANKLPPATVTDSRTIHAPQEQYTWAPSNTREETNVNSDEQVPDELLDGSTKPLPKMVSLFEQIENRQAGSIIMGINEENELIQVPISQIFHHLVGGMSGWGKSVYLRGLVYQLMREADSSPIQIGLADIENNTFPEFIGKDHIEWYASNAIEIEHMTTTMLKEVERRKNLYEAMKGGTPKDIERYNILAERELRDNPSSRVEKLPIIVLLYDEFSAFMANRVQAQHKRILADIYQLALRARKYGIFLVLAGQSFKADIVDTNVVSQFGFNVCFRVRTVHNSISIIGQPGAESLTQQGEALMKTKEGQIVRIQALYVDDDQLIDALTQYEKEDTSSIVPEMVKEIVTYSREKLGNKVLFKELEAQFRSKGLSRKDLMMSFEWMDSHGFITRGEKNARLLNEEVIEQAWNERQET